MVSGAVKSPQQTLEKLIDNVLDAKSVLPESDSHKQALKALNQFLSDPELNLMKLDFTVKIWGISAQDHIDQFKKVCFSFTRSFMATAIINLYANGLYPPSTAVLSFAITEGNKDIFNSLLAHATVRAQLKDDLNNNYLTRAIEYVQAEMVQELLNCNEVLAHFDRKLDGFGYSDSFGLLRIAISSGSRNMKGSLAIVKMLMEIPSIKAIFLEANKKTKEALLYEAKLWEDQSDESAEIFTIISNAYDEATTALEANRAASIAPVATPISSPAASVDLPSTVKALIFSKHELEENDKDNSPAQKQRREGSPRL